RVVDSRAALQNRTSTRAAPVRWLGTKNGGGAPIYERKARNNKEAAQRMQDTGDFGNEAYMKGSTVPLSAVRDLENASDPNHHRFRVEDGVKQWQAADGTWLNRQQIAEGHRTYKTGSEKQKAFGYVLGKAEAQTAA